MPLLNPPIVIKADIRQQKIIKKPVVTQNDSVILQLEVLENGLPYDLTGATTVSLANKRKSDSVVVVTPGTFTGNIATFNLGTNELEKTGEVYAKAQFYDADDRVSTLTFSYVVEGDPTGAGYVPSVDEMTLIEAVMNDAQQKIDELSQVDVVDLASQLADTAKAVVSVFDYGVDSDTLQTRLNLAITANNMVTIPTGTYVGDLLIDNLANKTIVFNQVKITGNVRFSRLKNFQQRGKLTASGNIDLIGASNCKFDAWECNLVYLQNFAGWGGVYWIEWGEIVCKAMQVRQAKLNPSTSVSAINQNFIRKLIAQYGLAENNWNNVWFRNGASGSTLVYTTVGTVASYVGDDKWDTLYTNPFVIENFDFSYTNAPVGTDSYGIIHEGVRPVYLNAGFVENVTYATKGKLIVGKLETRNTKVQAIDGTFEYTPAETIGKLATFKPVPIGLINNSEFNEGLKGYSLFGKVALVTATSISAPISHSGLAVKIEQDVSVPSRLITSFLSPYTGAVSIVVRGKNIGDIVVQDGSIGTQYTLGYSKDSSNFGYSVGRATITKGQTITVSVYTPAYTTLGSGEITLVTGVQVFMGYAGTDIKQTGVESKYSTLLPQSTAENQWQDGFNIYAPANSKIKLSFEIIGKVEGRGSYQGYFEGVVAFDATKAYDVANSSITVKSYVYKDGEATTGVASVDTRFISKVGGGITVQFAKLFFGTSLSSEFVNIKATFPATLQTLTPGV